jgi:hypothetical protein
MWYLEVAADSVFSRIRLGVSNEILHLYIQRPKPLDVQWQCRITL